LTGEEPIRYLDRRGLFQPVGSFSALPFHSILKGRRSPFQHHSNTQTLIQFPVAQRRAKSKESIAMPAVTIMPSGKIIEIERGTRILDILIESKEMIGHKCGGKASCGTCHIFVTEGRKSLSKIERIENERLDAVVGVGSKSRLACQAKVGTENITVEILGFASGL